MSPPSGQGQIYSSRHRRREHSLPWSTGLEHSLPHWGPHWPAGSYQDSWKFTDFRLQGPSLEFPESIRGIKLTWFWNMVPHNIWNPSLRSRKEKETKSPSVFPRVCPPCSGSYGHQENPSEASSLGGSSEGSCYLGSSKSPGQWGRAEQWRGGKEGSRRDTHPHPQSGAFLPLPLTPPWGHSWGESEDKREGRKRTSHWHGFAWGGLDLSLPSISPSGFTTLHWWL